GAERARAAPAAPAERPAGAWEELARRWLARLREGTGLPFELRQRLVRTLVQEVEVGEERVRLRVRVASCGGEAGAPLPDPGRAGAPPG
ncbi:MAG: hypothetical protein K6U79_10110, partial [Firmicutes bacterium]|nr:hypothetical protein [Bacillota bacterium]